MHHRSARRFKSLIGIGALALLTSSGLAAVTGKGGSTASTLFLVATTQGFMMGGGLAELAASDDAYVEVAAMLDGNKYVTTTLIGATSPYASVSTLDLTIEAGADASQPTRFVVALLDHDSGQWRRVGSFRADGDSFNMFDGVNRPDRYVDKASGTIWAMVTTSVPMSRAPDGYTLRLDMVEMGVMP